MATGRALLAVAASLSLVATMSACAGSVAPAPEPSLHTAAPSPTAPSVNPRRVGPTPADDAERAYVAEARSERTISIGIPGATDTQLLVAGWSACAMISRGMPVDRLQVIEDEPADEGGGYPLSASIAAVAAATLCPSM